MYKIHGKSNTRLHAVWRDMKARCYNKNRSDYERYGGRGIKVCNEWLHDFMAFYNWAINNGYKDDLTIDRIDTNKGYSPSNCRWADKKTQSRNRRNIKGITLNNETHCLSEWCEILNLDFSKIRTRIYSHGWSIKRALELEE